MAQAEAQEGGKKARQLASNEHVMKAVFIKGGPMTKLTEAGEPKKKWDYALCQRKWFKFPVDADHPAWDEGYAAIHSIEPDLEDGAKLHIWLYKQDKKGGSALPKLCCRSLLCENEGDRDDWALSFRTLLMNFWHESLESTIIPAPEVYQYHTFVATGAGGTPHLLALSSSAPPGAEERPAHPVSMLRIATALPNQPAQQVLAAELKDVTVAAHAADARKLNISVGGKTTEVTMKDPIEALTVAAEIKRLQVAL
eukprot:TRINITY_DN33584_c0_g1_i1.p1 TRINITY_DN33584_c0_g1~~TRINITY_DN33584_c0_g1_i1.p1  ORF type:complete len:254 (+),score=89.17 TRINITY_DN33584_c0_g1_i1:116-877(+)